MPRNTRPGQFRPTQGKLHNLWGSLLGSGGVESQAPGDVDFNDSSFDANTMTRYQPKSGFRNFLSGGADQRMADTANIQQTLADQMASRALQDKITELKLSNTLGQQNQIATQNRGFENLGRSLAPYYQNSDTLLPSGSPLVGEDTPEAYQNLGRFHTEAFGNKLAGGFIPGIQQGLNEQTQANAEAPFITPLTNEVQGTKVADATRANILAQERLSQPNIDLAKKSISGGQELDNALTKNNLLRTNQNIDLLTKTASQSLQTGINTANINQETSANTLTRLPSRLALEGQEADAKSRAAIIKAGEEAQLVYVGKSGTLDLFRNPTTGEISYFQPPPTEGEKLLAKTQKTEPKAAGFYPIPQNHAEGPINPTTGRPISGEPVNVTAWVRGNIDFRGSPSTQSGDSFRRFTTLERPNNQLDVGVGLPDQANPQQGEVTQPTMTTTGAGTQPTITKAPALTPAPATSPTVKTAQADPLVNATKLLNEAQSKYRTKNGIDVLGENVMGMRQHDPAAEFRRELAKYYNIADETIGGSNIQRDPEVVVGKLLKDNPAFIEAIKNLTPQQAEELVQRAIATSRKSSL